jgi:hypothetical protein
MLTSRAVVASILLVAACGGKGGVTPRGQRTASDCERLVRHSVAIFAAENGAGAPTSDQPRDLDAFVAERCADAAFLARVNNLPDAIFGCLLKAKTVRGNQCFPGQHSPPPGPACSAFAGATDGSGTLIGVVISATGAPLPGAGVALRRDGEIVQNQLTDTKGGYVMLSITPGTYQVTVYAGDQIVPRQCVDIAGADGTTTVDVTVP